LVEQLICNQQVIGSSPIGGSRFQKRGDGRARSGGFRPVLTISSGGHEGFDEVGSQGRPDRMERGRTGRGKVCLGKGRRGVIFPQTICIPTYPEFFMAGQAYWPAGSHS
jgi:hypothetical protein